MTKYYKYSRGEYDIEFFVSGTVSHYSPPKLSINLVSVLLLIVAITSGFTTIRYVAGLTKSSGSTSLMESVSEKTYPEERIDVQESVYDHKSIYERFRSTGIVFPDSSTRELTEEDLQQLIDTKAKEAYIVNFAINEIYARCGYRFGGGKYATLYSLLGYKLNCSMEEAEAKFNIIESKNINHLVKCR